MSTATPLLEIRDLEVSFDTDEGVVRAVDKVDLSVRRGETIGIVGESGSGKSVSCKAIMQLLPKHARIGDRSRIEFTRQDGSRVDIAKLDPQGDEIRRIRGGEIAMIFQEPMASFSPVYTIGNQMGEAIRLHRTLSPVHTIGSQMKDAITSNPSHGRHVGSKEAREIAVAMLDRVGIANAGLRVDQYPHELSGGMRQRAMIATALSTNPSLLIADEPTTALDVTIQAQILDLMRELQDEFGMAIIFITHDMGVIAQIADEIAVMYLGRIAERGATREVIFDPKHPYTQGLLAAIPRLEVRERRLTPIAGDIPSPLERPTGCPFHTRCSEKLADRCDRLMPAEVAVTQAHHVSCLLHG